MSAPGNDRFAGYEDVRRALHERGYLETPLDRLFVGGLGDPLGRRRARRFYSACLAGLLAGPPLGLILALTVWVEGRGAVPAWPDGALYALLFALVTAVVVALCEGAAGLLIRVLARVRPRLSPRRASLAAGLVVAGGLALYLGAWWVAGGARIGFGDALTLAALALGAGFAGRVVAAAALAQAALVSGRAPSRRRPRVALWALGLSALAAAAAAGIASLVAGSAPTGAPVVKDAAAPRRALFVAWDGMSAELLAGLRRVDQARAEAPLAGGARGVSGAVARGIPGAVPRAGEAPPERTGDASARTALLGAEPWGLTTLRPPAETDPVAVWTTVAAGSRPAEHGVTGFEMPGLRGAAAPAPRPGLAAGPLDLLLRLWPTERRVVRAGVRRVPSFWEVAAGAEKTAVVGWWGTWPAGASGTRGGYVVSDVAVTALRRGRGVEQAFYPSSWGVSRGARWLAAADAAAATDEGTTALPPGGAAVAREALAIDLFALDALADAFADPAVGLGAVYLPGQDILRARLRELGADPFAALEALARHARIVDRRLGALLADGGADMVWVAALPGRAGAGERGFVARRGAGPGAGALNAVDVAPSFLAAAGLPIDDRMSGAAVAAGPNPPRRLRTATGPAAPPSAPEGLEQDVLERLKSLGYVK